MEETKGTILYAEDYDSLRLVTMKILQKKFSDYNVEPFADGSSLEDRLKKGANRVKLVLLDQNMPGKTGLEIIKEYSRACDYIGIPFVLYYADEEYIGFNALMKGAFAYLHKNQVQTEDFVLAIREALDYAESHAGLT